jgi:chemotaxis protein MotA
MERGKLLVLMQPAELIIIGGAAIGTLLVANPLPIVIKICKGALAIIQPSRFSKPFYLETLKMLNELFSAARKSGLDKLEADIEDPSNSPILSKYPKFLNNPPAVHFLCDTLRMVISGGVGPFEMDQLMELDMETHHKESQAPIAALTAMADSLPGLGIVAAVLGVVITMGALGGPPEEVGHKVAAALVGTFLGILLCYGFFGPIGSLLAKVNDAEGEYLQCLRVGTVAFVRGTAPRLATEFARRAIPPDLRPSFTEMEEGCKPSAAAPVQSAA